MRIYRQIIMPIWRWIVRNDRAAVWVWIGPAPLLKLIGWWPWSWLWAFAPLFLIVSLLGGMALLIWLMPPSWTAVPDTDVDETSCKP